MATQTNLSCCTFVLREYQKINSSMLPVIFISFKTKMNRETAEDNNWEEVLKIEIE